MAPDRSAGHTSTWQSIDAGSLLRGDRVVAAGTVWRPVIEVSGLGPAVSEG